MDLDNLKSLAFFYPEATLAAAALLIVLGDLVVKNKQIFGYAAAAGSIMALVATVDLYGGPSGRLFHRMVVLDPFALFFKVVAIGAALFTVWISLGSKEIREVRQGEYYTLLMASALGMCLMASASNLLMAYLALELVSLTSYALTGFLPHSRRSSEAALKYLIYGGVASGAMIYGMSWIFGLTGSLDYGQINAALFEDGGSRLALFIAFVLILAGFGYKVVFVPFHMWSPDVYQGAPTPITAFLSVGSNAAGIAILMRFFFPAASRFVAEEGSWLFVSGVEWPHFLLVLSMVTMTLGNLCALNQRNLKRMLAYSGIAHAGYMLMGLVVLSDDGLAAILFYVAVYLIMNLGAFLIVVIVADATGREDVEGYRGLAWRGAAIPAVSMAIFLFSLTGLPPFAGFIGKFFLFAAVIRHGFYLLAVVAVVNSVISLYYYAYVVKAMFLDKPEVRAGEVTMNVGNSALLGVLVVLTVLFGLYWGPLIYYADRSATFIN
jgi:NADH-quinone oxidoreductase subunit N